MGWSTGITKGRFASVNISFVIHKKQWTGLLQSPFLTWKIIFVCLHPHICVCVGTAYVVTINTQNLEQDFSTNESSCGLFVWFGFCFVYIFHSSRGHLCRAYFDLRWTYLKLSHILVLIVTSWDVGIWALQTVLLPLVKSGWRAWMKISISRWKYTQLLG